MPLIHTMPEEQKRPQREIYKTARIQQPMPTNRWWSALAWKPFSVPVYAHPLTFKETREGLETGYPPVKVGMGEEGTAEIHALHCCDMTIGGVGFTAKTALVDGFGDWNVHIRMEGSGMDVRYSIAHGQPFVFTEYRGTHPRILFQEVPEVWICRDSWMGVRVQGRIYAFYAPEGAQWNGLDSAAWECILPEDKKYFTAAVLPAAQEDIFNHFGSCAFRFVTDTHMSWQYVQEESRVYTRFAYETECKAGEGQETIAALYPHQWKHVEGKGVPYTYDSPRGTMKCVEGSAFTTGTVYHGMLPFLPVLPLYSEEELRRQVRESVERERNGEAEAEMWEEKNTYWEGKRLNRLANLLPLVHLLQENEAEAFIAGQLKSILEDWFGAQEGKQKNVFYYDSLWNTVIGYPSGFGSDTDLNDHHFHYGYWIAAAAVLAMHDRIWGADPGWMGMVEELIGDIANNDRSSTRYPFLRCFDPYAGHSWASGAGLYPEGNNQESSSEALNAWYGLILWGEASGKKEIRDLGIYLYATEVTAVKEYWFDTGSTNFPADYRHHTLGIVWGGKGTYTTWWTKNPEGIHGIQFLPITGGSLYLGHDPAYVRKNYQDMKQSNGGQEARSMQDILWSFEAFADSAAALQKFLEQEYVIEYSESKAHTWQWIYTLHALGDVCSEITADKPLYAVFRKNGVQTYVAYHAGEDPAVVTFSDGYTMDLLPGRFSVMQTTLDT